MSEVSTISPASTSEFPVFTFTKASSTVIMPEDVFSNSPVMLRLPVIVVLPVNVIFPVLPANVNGVLVTPPSFIVKLKSYHTDFIKKKAIDLGFISCGISKSGFLSDLKYDKRKEPDKRL